MHNKKASMMEYVAVAALILLAFFVSFSVWSNLLGKGNSELTTSISDSDNDGVLNRIDKCPCPPQGIGVPNNDGCPQGYKIKNDGTGAEDKSCFTKK